MTRTRDLSRIPSAIQIVGAPNNVLPTVDNAANLGSVSFRWIRIFGESTSALYADLAERYEADAIYPEGTVLVIGGTKEVTTTSVQRSTRVAGIVSVNPAFRMNDGVGQEAWPFIALAGRVPCRVIGRIHKGDRLGTSWMTGVAYSLEEEPVEAGSVIGLALESYDSDVEGKIEVMVKSA